MINTYTWHREQLANGDLRYRLRCNNVETPVFIDKSKHNRNYLPYVVYGSGMSEQGFAKQLHAGSILKHAKIGAIICYEKLQKEQSNEPTTD